MAFDQNSAPKDVRQINIVNPPRSDVITGPPSVPVYFVPATVEGNVVGLGPVNPGQAPGVAAWTTRLPAPIGPPSSAPAQPSISPSGFVQNPSLGSQVGSNATDQASDDGGDDSVSGKKVKLLCSFGGKILPRPSDGMLRYVGGQTRIISLRRDVSCSDLVQKMAEVCGQPVVLKYQLPNEDLDALVSVSCSDDLENMMDEYEKLLERSTDGSAKLRVFLFSVSELDSSGMVQFGDLQDSSQKYVEAVNGVMEVGGSRITRKGSIASATSTQNSDLSGADAIDASLLGQDGAGTQSTNVFSPRSDTPAANDSSLRSGSGDNNPGILPENSGFPLLVQMAPETMLERTVHRTPADHPTLGFDLQQLAANFPPPPPPYLQGFVDPQQDASNSTEYQKLPSQLIYTNPPQMVPTTTPVFLQPQFHDPSIVPQQFVPAAHMTMGTSSSHLSMNPNMMTRLMPSQQVVAIPSDQGYNAYHAQVPSGRVAGYGWPQVPTTQEHVPFPEGWMPPHQQVILPENIPKIDGCTMCQKQLPHAHSDGLVQEQRDRNASSIVDVNSMYRSLRPEDLARFQPVNNVVVPSQADVAGAPRNLEVHSEGDRIASDLPGMSAPQNVMGIKGEVQTYFSDALGNVGQCRPEDGVHHFIPPIAQHVRQEVSMSKSILGEPVIATEPLSYEAAKDYMGPVVAQDVPTGFTVSQEHQVINQPENLPVNQPLRDDIFIQPSQQMMRGELFSNNVFINPVQISETNVVKPVASPSDLETVLADNILSSMAASNWNGNIQESANSLFSNQDPWNFRQESHYPPPRPSKLAPRKEAYPPRDSFHDNQLSHEMEPNAQAHILDTTSQYLNHIIKDQYSDQPESNQGSSDDLIKQELQATAEGVAASVLKSSLASSADTSSNSNQDKELQNNSDAVIQAKLEGMNVKPEKANLGFPVSDGLGSLQVIKNSDLEELRELGSGTFGTVYHGKWRGTDVAIKRINDRCFAGKPSEQERMREDFWNEASRLAELHHPNVVAFYGVVLDGPGGTVATVTEYMVNGSLRSALQKNERSIEKRKRLLIAMDVAFGMEYLHSRNIVHFDLKSDNLLVNLRDPHRPICKVGDLGLSKVKCKTLISGGVRGTLPWMAPELLNGSSSLVSEKVDVFSFAIVMWELLTGEEPYSDLHYGAIIGGIVSNTLRPCVPGNCDPEWRFLMEKCWSAEPSERPSFTEVANELRLMSAKIPPKGQAPATNTRTQAQGV